MSKITLDNIASGYDLSKINVNFQKIASELNDKVLYRDAPVGEANSLETDLDVNGRTIFNVPLPTVEGQPATKGYVDSLAGDIEADVAAAANSATQAANSASAAAGSAAAIAGYVDTASLAASNASASEFAASVSASSASSSVTTATNKASEASISASNASSSASSASSSASTASSAAIAASNAAGLAAGYLAPVTATSSSSVLIGTGSKSFTVETGKQFVAGHPVRIVQTSAPNTNYMLSTVTSYNSGTGALVVDVTSIVGSGTYSDWTLSISASSVGIASTTSFTPAGNIAATNVQTAIEELDIEKASTSHMHSASVVTVTPSGNLSSSNVQAALQELQTDVDSRQLSDATLTALAGVTTASNTLIYATASDTFTTTTLTVAGRALLDDDDAAAQRATLGLGSAATLTAGTAANNLVQLTADAKLPSVDGSLLTNVSALPSQTGNSGKYLTTDGSSASWGTIAAYSAGLTALTPIATTSGTSVEFTTIPSTATHIKIVLKGISGNTLAGLGLIQAGPSGGVATASYNGVQEIIRNAASTYVSSIGSITTGIVDTSALFNDNVVYTVNGVINMYKTNPSSDDWAYEGVLFGRDTGAVPIKIQVFGTKTFTGPITRIKYSVTSGTFDAGSFCVMYQ